MVVTKIIVIIAKSKVGGDLCTSSFDKLEDRKAK